MKRIFPLAAAATAAAAAVSLTLAGGASEAASTPQRAGLPTISVAMNGNKIAVSGTLQSGGVRIVSHVTREAQAEPILVRLEPGVTVGQFFKLVQGPAGADPNYLDGYASIVVDAFAHKGSSYVQTDLAAGQYVAFDAIRNNPATWPFTTFTVSTASSPAKLPKPKATVYSIEFGFRGASTLHDGELVQFANHGFLVHMITYAVARNHAQAKEIARLLHEGKEGKAQRLAVGFGNFAGPLSHGGLQQLVVHTRPGYIVVACFMQTQDGRDHVLLGMERVLHIVK